MSYRSWEKQKKNFFQNFFSQVVFRDFLSYRTVGLVSCQSHQNSKFSSPRNPVLSVLGKAKKNFFKTFFPKWFLGTFCPTELSVWSPASPTRILSSPVLETLSYRSWEKQKKKIFKLFSQEVFRDYLSYRTVGLVSCQSHQN